MRCFADSKQKKYKGKQLDIYATTAEIDRTCQPLTITNAFPSWSTPTRCGLRLQVVDEGSGSRAQGLCHNYPCSVMSLRLAILSLQGGSCPALSFLASHLSTFSPHLHHTWIAKKDNSSAAPAAFPPSTLSSPSTILPQNPQFHRAFQAFAMASRIGAARMVSLHLVPRLGRHS